MNIDKTVAFLSAATIRKKESPLEPFKRTEKLAEELYNKALNDLECATQDLVHVTEKKLA